MLADKAKELGTYIAGSAYLVRDDDFPDRYFNYGFILSPDGELVYKRAKLQVEPLEPAVVGTCVPHDVWDKWIEVKGGGDPMQALYPVARPGIAAEAADGQDLVVHHVATAREERAAVDHHVDLVGAVLDGLLGSRVRCVGGRSAPRSCTPARAPIR